MSGLHALAAELALRANFAELGEARCPASAETQRDGSGQASGASTETCEALEEGSEEAEDEDEEEEAGCLLGLSAAVGPGLDTDTGKRPRHRGGRTRVRGCGTLGCARKQSGADLATLLSPGRSSERGSHPRVPAPPSPPRRQAVQPGHHAGASVSR